MAQAKFYTAEIVLGLQHIHAAGLLYRDLKPDNVLVGRDGHLLLTDFNLSKGDTDRTNTWCGTEGYMAPEVLVANASSFYGKEADWFSLGVLIYEMLTGELPFYDQNPKIFQKKVRRGIFDCRRLPCESARDLVRGLLQVDPKKRLTGEEVKNHPFFSGLDWNAILNKSLEPPLAAALGGVPRRLRKVRRGGRHEGFGGLCSNSTDPEDPFKDFDQVFEHKLRL